MCPNGSEGTSYALLTTMSNVAYSVAYAIGDLLTGEWRKGRTSRYYIDTASRVKDKTTLRDLCGWLYIKENRGGRVKEG